MKAIMAMRICSNAFYELIPKLVQKFYKAIGIDYLNIEQMSTSVPVVRAWIMELVLME